MMTVAVNAWTVGPGAIVLLGDSNTEMMRPTAIGGCQIINAGFGGARIADIARRADGLADLTRPAIVHIMIGTNDAMDGVQQGAVDSLAGIVDAFQKRGATVVLWRLPPSGPKAGDLANFRRINDLITNVAKSKGVELESDWAGPITGSDGYAKQGWLIGDDIHLTPNGQAARVARIAALDSSILRQRNVSCAK
ncbi:SGNH/GDSL hydrolase family protein [Rhizobium ruizarguesonis]|uniref:SGNH hydrolase-type esterase domain-containing protein n=2 Tax=Rhizobium TaxID=379 RepID=A0A179BUA7_RHILE|nr:hypothetical protein A4U53_17860 [Rhizobium leguminosarum]